MLCVLGGPGSGVLDLLQVLTRRQKNGGSIQVHGEILVNGSFPGEKFKRIVSYIPKTENHLARLKVRETLEFSARIRAPAHMTEEQIQDNVDTALKWMDMNDPEGKIQETYVGDATLKGISGGQKRRLSFGVEAVSGYSVLVADLPTNGLDAKTAYTVVESAKRVAMAGKSMIMSVVQPSPELFDLFDNVLVLSYGEMIYFGPQFNIEEYFQNLGFERPSTKSLPAWIEEITVNPKKYYPGTDFESNTALCDMMVQKYQASDFCQELGKKLWEQTIASRPPKPDMFDTLFEHPSSISLSFDMTYDRKLQAAGELFGLPKGISCRKKVGYCFKRQITVQMRDTQSLIYRALQALVISIFLGIIFFGLDPAKHDKHTCSRIGFCFFAVGFMGFGAVPFIPGLANVRSVFYYQIISSCGKILSISLVIKN
jgi:ABC-type multidrug transport system ATPase subunit